VVFKNTCEMGGEGGGWGRGGRGGGGTSALKVGDKFCRTGARSGGGETGVLIGKKGFAKLFRNVGSLGKRAPSPSLEGSILAEPSRDREEVGEGGEELLSRATTLAKEIAIAPSY
jgi:hypothetical protein